MDCSLETSAFAVSYSEGRENPNEVRRNRPSFVRYHRKVLPQNVRQVLNSIIIKRNGFVMNTRLLLGALATAAVLVSPAHAKLDGKVPEPGMVTFVTFSADGCQPCRLMEPALRKLDQEYEGRAAIREINTSEYPELVAVLPHRGRAHPDPLRQGRQGARLAPGLHGRVDMTAGDREVITVT